MLAAVALSRSSFMDGAGSQGEPAHGLASEGPLPTSTRQPQWEGRERVNTTILGG